MPHRTLERLQRYRLRIFADPPAAVSPRAIIPIFHRWIQHQAVDGLLIDVADYTHLPDGPSALLVGHEANYAIDGDGGRPGLSYSRKREADGALVERLAASARTLLRAARRLEEDLVDAPGDPFTFRGEALEVVANDRLAAPNHEETATALHDVLESFGRRLYGSRPTTLTRLDGDRLGFTIQTPDAISVATLLKS